MDDTSCMGMIECCGDLTQPCRDLRQAWPISARYAGGDGATRDERQYQISGAVRLAVVVDSEYVGVVECGESTRLGIETAQEIIVDNLVRIENLHSNSAFEAEICSEENARESPLADEAVESISPI